MLSWSRLQLTHVRLYMCGCHATTYMYFLGVSASQYRIHSDMGQYHIPHYIPHNLRANRAHPPTSPVSAPTVRPRIGHSSISSPIVTARNDSITSDQPYPPYMYVGPAHSIRAIHRNCWQITLHYSTNCHPSMGLQHFLSTQCHAQGSGKYHLWYTGSTVLVPM